MARLDPAKIFLWSCFGLAAVGAGAHLWLTSRIESAETDANRALTRLSAIRQNALDVDILEREKAADEYLSAAGQVSRINAFFAKAATQDARMSLGPSVGNPRREDREDHGFRDTHYELSWKGGGRNQVEFTRSQIAHFLWAIESKSRLLKISEINLRTEERERDDLWTPTFWVTERMPLKSADDEG